MKNQYTFDVDLYSVLYKDVYGFRPRGNAWENWITASDDEKQVMWDFLLEDLEQVLAAERELEKDNIARFENLVDSLITSGAGDRETAIRWIKEAGVAGEEHALAPRLHQHARGAEDVSRAAETDRRAACVRIAMERDEAERKAGGLNFLLIQRREQLDEARRELEAERARADKAEANSAKIRRETLKEVERLVRDKAKWETDWDTIHALNSVADCLYALQVVKNEN